MTDTSGQRIAIGGLERLSPAGPVVSTALAFALVAGAAGINAQTLPGPRPPELEPVAADGYDFRFELGIEHSDNRGRFNPRGPSDTLLIPRVDIKAFRSGRRLDLRAIGQAEFRYSLPDRFEDEFRANVRAEVDWTLVPNRLAWTFVDVASVEPVDVLAVDSPANQQQTNVLATGPELRLGTDGPWRGVLRGRFTASQAEETEDFDTNRSGVLARAIRSIGPSRQLVLEAEAADVRVRDARFIDAEHRRGDVSARFSTEGARGSLDLTGGYSWTEFDVGPSPSEPHGRLELAWKNGDALRAYLAASHELSDAVRDLLNELKTLDPNRILRLSGAGGSLRVGAEVFVLDNIEAGLDYSGLRQRLNIAMFYRDFDFVRGNSALDFSENGAVVAYTRRVSEATTAGTALLLERRRFDVESRRNTDLSATLYLQRRLNSRFAFRASLSRKQRWSNAPAADSRENVIGLALIVFGGRS